MSTRAIIGIKEKDGTISGAWNWNNGYDIKESLVKNFRTIEDVRFLLNLGMFNTIYTKKDFEEYEDFLINNNIDTSDKQFIRYKNSVITQDSHHRNRAAEQYKDTMDILSQDISIAYIFQNGKWVTYGQNQFSRSGRQ